MDKVTSLDAHRLRTQGKLSQEAATDIILHQDAQIKELKQANQELLKRLADSASKINVLAPIAVALLQRQWDESTKASEYGTEFQTAKLLELLNNFHLDIDVSNETGKTVMKATRKASNDGQATNTVQKGN